MDGYIEGIVMKKKVDEKGIIYLEQPQIPTLSLVISLFSLLLISLGTLSIFAIQKPLQESQTITSKAAVQNGPVIVTSDHSPDQLSTHQINKVDLLINTSGIQTQGVTLVFNVVTATTDVINVETLGSANLKAKSQEVQKTSDGFLVKVVAVPTGTAPFSSTSATRFLRITFNPQSAGLFRLAFDEDYSHVYLSTKSQELLGKIPQMDYSIVADAGNSCNHTCSTNDDCAVNLRCYNGACRSATNLSSDSCQTTTVVTQVGCNQGCATSSQCANGNTCFENRCRAPGNPDSTVCANVTYVTYNTITKACNASCSSNKECAVNLRCYNGACRLATNPSSTSCTPSNVPVVSSIYATPAPTPTPTPVPAKGEEVVPPLTSPSPLVATAQPSATPFEWPTPVPASEAGAITTPSPTPTATPTPAASPSFLDQLRAQAFLQNISFPLIAVVAGVLLLIISLLLLLTRHKRTPKNPPSGSASRLATANLEKQPTKQEQSLEERIAELRAAQKAPAAEPAMPVKVLETKPKSEPAPKKVIPPVEIEITPDVITPELINGKPEEPAAPEAPAPVKPVQKPTPKPEVKAEVKPEKETIVVPPSTLTLQTPVESAAPTAQGSSSMMDRLKYKGVMDKMPNPAEPDQGNK